MHYLDQLSAETRNAQRRANYKDPAYRRERAILKARTKKYGYPCALCGQPIDTTLPYNDPYAFTADHVVGVSEEGHARGELQPAHRKCNSLRGAAQGKARREARRKKYSYGEPPPGYL